VIVRRARRPVQQRHGRPYLLLGRGEEGYALGCFLRVRGAGEEMNEALWSGFVAGVMFIRGRRLLYCHDVARVVWRPRAACASREKETKRGSGAAPEGSEGRGGAARSS
jgi:hypothetical protein